MPPQELHVFYFNVRGIHTLIENIIGDNSIFKKHLKRFLVCACFDIHCDDIALGRCEQVDRTFTTNSLSAFEMPITPKT